MVLPDGDKLWDATLRRVDEVLEDEELVDQVEKALRKRRPKSRLLGRPGTPAEVVLRLLVLKHLYDWSFEECEHEVRGSLVYRAFCHLDCERVPDAKTLIRLAQALGPEVWKTILERLVVLARQRKGVRGLRLRVDTTVAETNIHGCRFWFSGQRTGRNGLRGETGGPAGSWEVVGGPPRASAPALVSACAALAHGIGRPDQQPEATSRTRALPVSRFAGHGTLERIGSHRQ